MAQAIEKNNLNHLLGFNAGYVNTVGFLALSGLFTAMITGNYVTLAAAIINGNTGTWAKLAALPAFCLIVYLMSMLCKTLSARQRPARNYLTVLIVIFLALAGWLMISLGPFNDSNAWAPFWAGMLLISAMATQNTLQRIHLASAPSANLMTGNTTQVMIDIASLTSGAMGDERAKALERLRKMVPAIVIYAIGCAAGAVAYTLSDMWCFALPPIFTLITLLIDKESLAAR